MNTPIRRLRRGAATASVLALSIAAFSASARAATPVDTPADAPPAVGRSMPEHGDPGSDSSMPGMMRHNGRAMIVMQCSPMMGAMSASSGPEASPTETPADAASQSGHAMPGHDAAGAGSQAMPGRMRHDAHAMMAMQCSPMTGGLPTQPGQDAFGAIQEIVGKLDADPKTDWSKVDLEALRQHLLDMDQVTLMADAAAKPIDGGIEIAVTGGGRTLAAIKRMVPAHAQEINGARGWSAKTEPLSNGVLLIVTAQDAKEVQRIRGLGFIGIMVSGSHHQAHHLAMAKGAMPHNQ